MSGILSRYDQGHFFCEIMGTSGTPPADYTAAIRERLDTLDLDALQRRAEDAERELYNLGITFTVYSDKDAIDRILPFDVIPRVISKDDWATLEAGVIQRVTTINLFLADIYGPQHVLRDGLIPPELVLQNSNFQEAMIGVKVAHNAYANICGIDVVRDEHGDFMVLEDNARTPSGVSYVLENRNMMLRAFPDLTSDISIRPVDDYGPKLQEAMVEIAPSDVADPQVVLLSPGTYNSAYFEHIFLAREMGVPLVEGRDLVVDDNDRVYMKTTGGLERVHTIYRRLNDDFLDPEVFRPESTLGVPGLMRSLRAGKVAIANSVGTGVADDKAVYAYMPRLIKYYLQQEPILHNVQTFICREKEALAYTLDNLDKLVVKPVAESGGYGITVGPKASKEELEACRANLLKDPSNYISQPTIALSVCPTLVEGEVEPRHVDLRPFAITGKSTWVLPGGLTRVAMRRGSLVVNSSQGGGSKDTWVLG